MSIQGETAPGFEAVRDAFIANAKAMGRGGAAFSAYQAGQKIVDLWGGEARPPRAIKLILLIIQPRILRGQIRRRARRPALA
jgi:hypothetical protein